MKKHLVMFLSIILLCIFSINCVGYADRDTRRKVDKILPTPEPIIDSYDDFYDEVTDADILEYFCELAVDPYDGHIKRWEMPIEVEINGDYTEEDYDFIINQLDILNDIGTIPYITVVESNGNFVINFVPYLDMADSLEFYEEGYVSYYNYYWNDEYQLTDFYMSVTSDITYQEERNYFVLTLLANGLGFYNNSSMFVDSIFYADSTYIQSFTDIDYYMISMLYSPMIYAGMDRETAEAVLAN